MDLAIFVAIYVFVICPLAILACILWGDKLRGYSG